jgi:diguanylate cyclase (GGDEF)-like protein
VTTFHSTPIDCDAQSPALAQLIAGIDKGVEEHVAWSQGLLRCVLLAQPPGDELTRADAHERCAFGRWFTAHREALARVDDALVLRVADAHLELHQAVRRLCAGGLADPSVAGIELPAFEQSQRSLVAHLQCLRERLTGVAGMHDALTGLPLRHGLPSAFEMRSKDAERAGACLWLAMIDIDHFKAVNDTHGHLVGDQALRHVAASLAGGLRQSDALFRVGGEEFLALVLVPGSAAAPCEDEVRDLAGRLLVRLRQTPLQVRAGLVLSLTATIGLARVWAGDALDAATGRADQALLQGKQQGRDRVVVAC